MIDLDSDRWTNLQAVTGSAVTIPQMILAFRDAPCEGTFDSLFEALTGVGDIAVTPAFFAAFPHILGVVAGLRPEDRVEYCCHLSWVVALGCSPSSPKPPSDVQEPYRVALEHFREILAQNMLAVRDRRHLRYLSAGMAAISGDYCVALGLVHADSALSCPSCNQFLKCRTCGHSVETWPDLFDNGH